MFRHFVVIVLALVLLASTATALDFEQKEFYGQGVLALPIGNLSNIASIGFGAGGGMRVPHTEQLSFRGELSYIYFSTKDFIGLDWSWSMIPVNVLAEYQMESLYLLGGLGLVFVMSEVTYKHDTWDGLRGSFSDTGSEIGLILGAGFELSPSMVLEGRLNMISNANFLSANLCFRF